MANLQIKGIHDDLYEDIKRLAAHENRSISQQVVFLLKEYLARRKFDQTIHKTPAQVLLALSGSWQDDNGADQIIGEIRQARKKSIKLKEGF